MKTVLLVDDVHDCIKPLAMLLGRQGFRAAIAENGAQALGYLNVLAADAVVLDLVMPVLDGFGFLEAIRSQGRWDDLPVVAYTARRDAEVEDRLKRLGVTCCLRKADADLFTVLTALQDVLVGQCGGDGSGDASAQ